MKTPRSNYAGVPVNERRAELAERVANGEGVNEAGYAMGWTKGQISRVWQGIKKDLGAQAI